MHLTARGIAAVTALVVAPIAALSGYAVGHTEGWSQGLDRGHEIATMWQPDALGLVCQEDEVYGTIDGTSGVHCLNPDDPYVKYVGGVGWIVD